MFLLQGSYEHTVSCLLWTWAHSPSYSYALWMRNTTAALLCPTMHIHSSFQACRVSFHPTGFVCPFIWLGVVSVHPWEPSQALDLFCLEFVQFGGTTLQQILLHSTSGQSCIIQLQCHPTSGNTVIENSSCSLWIDHKMFTRENEAGKNNHL